jgi:putative spermidine/putrescine transport system permease protein
MKKIAPIFFLSFGVLPLAAGLVYALLYSLGIVGALAQGFSLDAWGRTLMDSGFWTSMALSGLMAAVVTLISTALALAYLMSMRLELEQARIRFLLHFPLALPPIVAAFLSFQWFGSSGILARIALKTGIIGQPEAFPPLINDPMYLGVGLTLTLSTFPFLLLIFMQHYKSANLLQISDLARTLGASAAQIRRRVIMPVLFRRAAPTLLLYSVFLFGAYEVPLLLGRQNPTMISMYISQKFRRFNLDDLPLAYVATVIYALLVMVLVVFFLRKSRVNEPHLSG